ncbi:MAG: hypothetical protein WAK17_19880 [Candidatus Nitrosopolaris sp.]
MDTGLEEHFKTTKPTVLISPSLHLGRNDAKIPVYDSAGACNDSWLLKNWHIQHSCLKGYSDGFYKHCGTPGYASCKLD